MRRCRPDLSGQVANFYDPQLLNLELERNHRYQSHFQSSEEASDSWPSASWHSNLLCKLCKMLTTLSGTMAGAAIDAAVDDLSGAALECIKCVVNTYCCLILADRLDAASLM